MSNLAPPPTLNVRRVDAHTWLFLEYEGDEFAAFGRRWYIESRPDQEGFWLVCNFPWTFASEPALQMIEAEIALVRPAVDEIRRQIAPTPPAEDPA